jgi:uncharacterized membrane protein YedE/YeeE
MTEAELARQTTHVLWAVFVLGAVFGAIGQRTRFCTMGAVADIVNIGDWSRMRMWVMAMAVAILGFNAMVGLGWLRAADSIYAAPRLPWLSHVTGGLLFGIGMVLASGCGSRTLVRIGAGNLKSVVVFLSLGLSAWATIRGITGVARAGTVDTVALTLGTGQDLPSLLGAAAGWPTTRAAPLLGALVGGAMLLWALGRAEGRERTVVFGGVGTGLMVVAVWWASGRLGFVAEHPLTLEPAFLATQTQRIESLTFVAPVAFTLEWLVFFSDASRVLTVGIVSAFGVIAGSALTALATRSFRWEGFAGPEDTANHLAGGALMGVGGVTALGCTVGQGITGLSTLALGSFITLAAILAGAVLGLRWQTWRVERSL